MTLSKEFNQALSNVSDAALKYAGVTVLQSIDLVRVELHKLFGEPLSVEPNKSAANDSPAKEKNEKEEA